MFEYFRGKLSEVASKHVVVEVGGVGYRVHVTNHAFVRLPVIGQEILIYLSPVVREDGTTLYGFLSKPERELFEVVMTVNGIGPKTALAVAGTFSLPELQKLVVKEEVAALCRIPGVGRKTAERLVVELKDKLCHLDKQTIERVAAEPIARPDVIGDAVNALVNLGYTQHMAFRAIKQALEIVKEEADVGKLITVALQQAKEAVKK